MRRDSSRSVLGLSQIFSICRIAANENTEKNEGTASASALMFRINREIHFVLPDSVFTRLYVSMEFVLGRRTEELGSHEGFGSTECAPAVTVTMRGSPSDTSALSCGEVVHFASASRFCLAQSLSAGTAFIGGPPSVPQAHGPRILASVMQAQDFVFRHAQT
jgi:hypothetical protein